MREEVKLKDTESMNKTMAFLIRQDVTNESLLQHYISFYLTVALCQKILEVFYIAKINIPNHYPEQKI